MPVSEKNFPLIFRHFNTVFKNCKLNFRGGGDAVLNLHEIRIIFKFSEFSRYPTLRFIFYVRNDKNVKGKIRL